MKNIIFVILCLWAYHSCAEECVDFNHEACQLMLHQNATLCHDRHYALRYCQKSCDLECYNCDTSIITESQCTETSLCRIGEYCMTAKLASTTDGHSHYYKLGCATKKTCDGSGLFVLGRRSMLTRNIDISCCGTDRCNFPFAETTTMVFKIPTHPATATSETTFSTTHTEPLSATSSQTTPTTITSSPTTTTTPTTSKATTISTTTIKVTTPPTTTTSTATTTTYIQTAATTTSSPATLSPELMQFCQIRDSFSCPTEQSNPQCGSDGVLYNNLCLYNLALCDNPSISHAAMDACNQP
ncbi:integumentary mucin C.1-like isoform X2 [Mya arenaria]|uniref:integumentary mucin C.1-like isoform X2 n=1 Tax=Mya arenaria TaxID=6604 RepID=UPI0022E483AE|nr:integumentary mucin C.1-like isoform X2 [Mya arenaria]